MKEGGKEYSWSLKVVRISDILSKVIITSLGSIKMITKRKVRVLIILVKDKIYFSFPRSCDKVLEEGAGIFSDIYFCGSDESQGCMCLIVWPTTLHQGKTRSREIQIEFFKTLVFSSRYERD